MKPCPRCGSADVGIVETGISMRLQTVVLMRAGVCNSCGLRGPVSTEEDSAVFLWDKLPRKQDGTLEEIKRRLAYLEAAVAKSTKRKR